MVRAVFKQSCKREVLRWVGDRIARLRRKMGLRCIQKRKF
jgi:hypothetical protein